MGKLLKKRNNLGITLITLIITIVIILILAGVAISVLTEDGIFFEKIRNSVGVYEEETQNEAKKVYGIMSELDNYLGNVDEYKSKFGVNKPRITEGMIPVKYNGTNWVKADETNANNDWYNYGAATGNAVKNQWANIVTVKENGIKTRVDYLSGDVGTVINDDDILTFFVWIPRYAYSIEKGYKTEMPGTTEDNTAKIAVKFLVGSTNRDASDTEYPSNYDASRLSAGSVTPMIVHPAFKLENKELTGIWVAKYEASGINDLTKTNDLTKYVGNRNPESTTDLENLNYTFESPSSSTVLTVKPGVPSWREIKVGDSQYYSMLMKNSTAYGWKANYVDSHLMKNSEWGAVEYLCYSEYGSIPTINASYSKKEGYKKDTSGNFLSTKETKYYYNLMTGEGSNTASTTGNEYGIYDINGGNFEILAAYLNNGNVNLLTNGTSRYFEQNSNLYTGSYTLKKEYERYWDEYEVGEDERINRIKIVESEVLTQNELLDKKVTEEKYNETRKRLVDEIVKNMSSKNGDGFYEVISNYSYYGVANTGTETNPAPNYTWLKGVPTAAENYKDNMGYYLNWNGDYTLINGFNRTFVYRGSNFAGSSYAGVGALGFGDGVESDVSGFRMVLSF